MTVKPVNNIINPDQDLTLSPSSMDAMELDRRVGEKMKEVVLTAEEAEESGGSSTEEVESPKSVARFSRKKVLGRRFVQQHNQILRVKEEEMMFFAAEDIGKTSLMSKEPPETTNTTGDRYPKRRVDVVVFSRPILPCSPLSGKTESESTVRPALH